MSRDTLRAKLVARLLVLRQECGTLASEWNTFDVDAVEDLNTLTDEQLIEVLEHYGQFEG